MEVRKRVHIDSSPSIGFKRARYDYLCIESDDLLSSSDYESESVNSLQDKETDVVRDTSDSSGSEEASEYEPVTTDEENYFFEYSSSSGTENIITAEEGGYVTIFETSLSVWATDCEDSDSSSGSAYGLRDFRNCIQCKSENKNPQFRYCEKCFQQRCRQCNKSKSYDCFPLCITCYKQRKSSFPPRPRPNKPKKDKNKENSGGTDTRSMALSQDSGVLSDFSKQGESSQEVLKHERKDAVQRSLNVEGSECTSIKEETEIDAKETAEKKDTVERPLNAEGTEGKIIQEETRIDAEEKDEQKDTLERSLNVERSESKAIKEEVNIDAKKKVPINVESNIEESVVSSKETVITNREPMQDQVSDVVRKDLSKEDDKSVKNEPITMDNKRLSNRKRKRENDDLLKSDELPAKTRLVTGLMEEKEMCIICNSNLKDSIFLHGRIAHMCCCYKCSIKTWKINKRCPMCNCLIKNVVKVFTS